VDKVFDLTELLQSHALVLHALDLRNKILSLKVLRENGHCNRSII